MSQWMRRVCAYAGYALACLTTLVGGERVRVAEGVSYEDIGVYDLAQIDAAATQQLSAFKTAPSAVTMPPAANAVRLYKVSYRTVIPDQGNRPTQATGLVAVPDGAKKVFPLVSYQHGTVFSKDEVPSVPEKSGETLLVLAQFAAQGYVVVAADYIGKGGSPEPDSYMVKQSTAQACYDMLTASQAVLADLKISTGGLFLSGWSQGAWSTLAFLRKLEASGVCVQAAGVAAEPSDIYVLLMRWINHPTDLDAAWIVGCVALFIYSYENYYGLSGLSQAAIRPAYRQAARDFYENKIGWADASKTLPKTVGEFLNPDFAAAGNRLDNAFFKQLADNEVYRWRMGAPVRYYYGEHDEVMPPYVATLPVAYQSCIGGAAAEAVCAGKLADHRGAFLFGLPAQKQWFDALRGSH